MEKDLLELELKPEEPQVFSMKFSPIDNLSEVGQALRDEDE